MLLKEVAYLGPIGTFSHFVAEKRYGKQCKLIPMPSILDVCKFVSQKPSSRAGIIPVENSSGGAIYETVDILMENHPRIHIREELSLDVVLALIGHKGEKIQTLYSHFAPLEHCETWIHKNLPRVKTQVVSSTAVAAIQAAGYPSAAALGSRRLGQIYNLDILKYPVQSDIPNVTVFLAVGGTTKVKKGADKTTLAAHLSNTPGALCTFLEAFRNHDVNLSRLISRPMRGQPRQYSFLVDVEGSSEADNVRKAMAVAARTCVKLRLVGSFPCLKPYRS